MSKIKCAPDVHTATTQENEARLDELLRAHRQVTVNEIRVGFDLGVCRRTGNDVVSPGVQQSLCQVGSKDDHKGSKGPAGCVSGLC